MIRRLALPDAPGPGGAGDARISAPSALRNRDAIAAQLVRLAPAAGRALELASGTGEHVIRFAAVMPGLDWQPTEPDAARRDSIAAWTVWAGAPNVRPPRPVDAARPGWSGDHGPVDLIVVVNLLHLIAEDEAATVLAEAARALAPAGLAVIYGPFLRDGTATSAGDAAFDAHLRAQDPAIGYKDVAATRAQLAAAGLRHVETVDMPANNLLLAVTRPGAP